VDKFLARLLKGALRAREQSFGYYSPTLRRISMRFTSHVAVECV
jgi:hypothetical protein